MTALVAAVLAVAAADPPVDLGTLDQKAPTADQLKVPKSDDGVPKVDLRAAVKGAAKADDKRTVYVLVTPVSNRELVGTWWVQAEVDRAGAAFTGEAQFGEEAGGAGEYFAVVAVATDKKWEVGEQVKELPAAGAYSKVKIVKRNP